jgi:hypothetical protein
MLKTVKSYYILHCLSPPTVNTWVQAVSLRMRRWYHKGATYRITSVVWNLNHCYSLTELVASIWSSESRSVLLQVQARPKSLNFPQKVNRMSGYSRTISSAENAYKWSRTWKGKLGATDKIISTSATTATETKAIPSSTLPVKRVCNDCNGDWRKQRYCQHRQQGEMNHVWEEKLKVESCANGKEIEWWDCKRWREAFILCKCNSPEGTICLLSHGQ